jgi:hypothetical protein
VARWLVVLVLLLSACTPLKMPPFNECHKAIAYAVYSRYDCVEYEI